MKPLFFLIKKNKLCVSAALILAFLANASQLLYTFLIGELVNRIESRSSVDGFFLMQIGFFLFSNGLTQYFYQLCSRYASEKMAHTMRMRFVGCLMQRSVSENEAAGAARSMSIVQNELTAANEYLSNTFFEMIGMFFTGILVFLFLIFQNAGLTMVILIPTIFIMTYVTLTGKKLSSVVSACLDEKSKINGIAYSAITNTAMIKLYDARSFILQKFEERLTKWGVSATRQDRLYALFNSLSGVLSKLPLLLLLLVGGYMVLNHQILLGTLIVFLNLQKNLTDMIMNMPMWLARFKVFRVNLSRVELQ